MISMCDGQNGKSTMIPRCTVRCLEENKFFHLILMLEAIKLCRHFLPSENGSVIGALFDYEIYQNLSRHNVVGFLGMPNYPDNKGFYFLFFGQLL